MRATFFLTTSIAALMATAGAAQTTQSSTDTGVGAGTSAANNGSIATVLLSSAV